VLADLLMWPAIGLAWFAGLGLGFISGVGWHARAMLLRDQRLAAKAADEIVIDVRRPI
jgi:hypothetical protein